jgi:glycosyltransferase involved in cell wall biosynthesis
MRIGVMLRAYDRPGGIGIYSRNIVKHLLGIDQTNHYVLMYNNRGHVGTYGDLPNVDEVYVPTANPLIWDQWYATRLVKRWGLDIVFHTKFTVPLFTTAKKVMALHGATWFVHPEIYRKLDLFYVRQTMKMYCRKADFLISNSDLTTRDHIDILGVSPDKIRTVYFAPGEEFRPIKDGQYLERIKHTYRLPERFMLTVTSYDPGKNFKTLLKAFASCRKESQIHLVVAGKDCDKYAKDFDLDTTELNGAVHFLGWVEQRDLPALYSLADVYVFPSIYETFGIPVLEAMACGCPVVASNTGAMPELAGDAALLVDPLDDKAITGHVLKIVGADDIAKHYRKAGLNRASEFSWNKTASQTLQILEQVYQTN